MSDLLFLIIIVLAIIFYGVLASFGGMRSADTEWQKELVERGLAQYCPYDGEWAWKGECE